LIAAELVFARGTPPEANYVFKHALVQDTAYESLLKSHRQVLHQRIAESLCDRFPDRAQEEAGLVHHRSGRTALGLANPFKPKQTLPG
jgi:predicted ATPase